MSPLKLDGSNGISGIDGTVNRPAVVGIDTTTGLQLERMKSVLLLVEPSK